MAGWQRDLDDEPAVRLPDGYRERLAELLPCVPARAGGRGDRASRRAAPCLPALRRG